MLITLICVAVFVIGLLLMILFRNYYRGWRDVLQVIGSISTVVGIFAIISVSIFLLVEHVNPTSRHLKALATRDSYVRILESNNSLYMNTDFYDSVIEWNKEIYDYQIWGDNIWTNWFWDKEVYEGLEPIDLSKEWNNGGNEEE